MLDTSTCIHVMRAEPATRLAARFNRFDKQICISSISLAELHFGAEKSKRVAENLREVGYLIDAVAAVVDFDHAAAADYGRVRAALTRQPIGPLDALIAAHARSRKLVIVTANVGEFSRVPNLRVENWLD